MKYSVWVLAGLGVVWVLLPYALANEPFMHSETYAVVAVIFLIAFVRMVVMQLRAGVALIAPREETIALAGVSLALLAAVLCCLLAPEPVLITGAPGKNIALAGHDMSLAFPTEALALTAPRDLHTDLHVAGGRVMTVGGRLPLMVGDLLLSIRAQTVATVEARGLGGDALTITQPLGNIFLSPVLLFPKTTPIAGLQLPSDVFSIPARARTVRAFLVSADLMHDPRIAHMSNDTVGVLFSVDDGNGKPLEHGIGFAADGLPQTLADITLVPKLGLFPSVAVASVPQPLPVLIGITAYLFGGAALAYRRRTII